MSIQAPADQFTNSLKAVPLHVGNASVSGQWLTGNGRRFPAQCSHLIRKKIALPATAFKVQRL
jgi:hypothetical protein